MVPSAPSKKLRSGPVCLAALIGLLVTAGLPGCGSEAATSAKACTPGQSIACAGTRACPGRQICAADGSGYGACDCSGGDGGALQLPTAGPHSGLLGATCQTSSDCRGGLECLTSDSTAILGEGPSAGICLTRCAVDHAFCASVDATSKCVVLDDGGTPSDPGDDVAYCLPGCKIGNPEQNDDKCRGRVDMVCSESPQGAGTGYCRPACRGDIDCAPRLCNLRTGLCGDALPSGDPIGAACSPADSRCAGGCIPVGSYGECSGVCSYGTAGCGQSSADGPLDYFCFLDPAAGSGAGDLGYCAKLCDCNDECGRADAVCEPRPDLSGRTQRVGVCGPATFTSGGARPNRPCN